jgi:hypothetical protein
MSEIWKLSATLVLCCHGSGQDIYATYSIVCCQLVRDKLQSRVCNCQEATKHGIIEYDRHDQRHLSMHNVLRPCP